VTGRLRVGVPAELLALPPLGGHGKVWHRGLEALRSRAEVTELAIGEPRGWRRRRIDVVLASGHEHLSDARCPRVAVVHEAGWFSPELRARLEPGFLAHIESRTAQAVASADAVLTPSARVRDDILAAYGGDPGRVHAVAYGVDATFSPAARGGAELVAAAAGDRAPYVLYAATLHPRKNLAALREAMATLIGEGVPHRLVVAGFPAPDRPDSSALQDEALAPLGGPGGPDVPNGRVIGLGQPSDAELAGLMAGAAAFCLPSLYEGFGLTALEALACGAPAVVSDRGSLPEVVGDAALVVAPEASAVTGALRTVLRDPEVAARLRSAGPPRAARFSWEAMAEGWFAVLRATAAAA
jgi:glycosyltransferase involved in cell wall biosynthesis